MLVYIGVCSMIGSLSVVTTQGLGTAIVTTIMDPNKLLKQGVELVQYRNGGPVVDGRQSMFMVSSDHPSPPTVITSGENEPGALDIRASFGSIRRYSSGRTYPLNNLNSHSGPNNLQRRSQSLNYGSSMTEGLPSILERSSSLSDIKRVERQEVTSVAPIDDEFYSKRFSNQPQDSTIHHQEILARNSFVRFLPSPTSPVEEQHTTPHGQNTTPSISSRKNSSSSPEYPHADERVINIPPIPSPLHPIDYIRHHLSPTSSTFDSSNNNSITSESYSGITPRNLNRNGSASGKKAQSMGFVDKIKLGIGDQDDDTEGL
ncbi:6058_t:CDS:2, partial [Racocetra fulgida]